MAAFVRGDPRRLNFRVYYGWMVVAAVFAITFVGFGCAYTFSAFIASFQKDFGASRGSVSLVFSLAGFLYFGLGLVTGPLADRWGARPFAVAGMVITGLGLMLAGAAHTLTEIYLAYGLGVGLGLGCALIPALGAVQRWFSRRRGFASGLAVSGIGVGTLVMPPLASFLIQSEGWRKAYLVLGVLAIVVGAGMALMIADDPREFGLGPDGDPLLPGTQVSQSAGSSVREAVTSRRFIGLYIACLICSFGAFVPFVHLVPSAMDHGIRQSHAVLLLATIGIGSTAGRFFLGELADRWGRLQTLLAMFAGMALAFAVWALSSSIWQFALFAVAYGIFYGGWVAVLAPVVMDFFGARNVSGILGVLYTSVALGTLVGPSIAGFIFDTTHSYILPIVASAGANVIAVVIVWCTSAPVLSSESFAAQGSHTIGPCSYEEEF